MYKVHQLLFLNSDSDLIWQCYLWNNGAPEPCFLWKLQTFLVAVVLLL